MSDLDDLKRHMDVLAERSERRSEQILEAFATLNEKLDRGLAESRSDFQNGFNETQALIKLSYSQLDQRLSSLESRVDRLEKLVLHQQ